MSFAPDARYRGRFAPTPSGPLHLGSLLTALASYLQARSHNGAWLLRIDDLDRPRCPAGMAQRILDQLHAHGLHWDEPVRYQTEHLDEYQAALAALGDRGLVYACSCTRAELERHAEGPDGPVYAGTCRAGAVPGRRSSLRLRLADETLCIEDGWQNRQCRRLRSEVGDFVLKRSDGQIAYQLACAVDERAQGISEVVRGCDLLGSSFRQVYVQKLLGWQSPAYRHLPVLLDGRGRKLSKQNHARPLESDEAPKNLYACLRLLNQAPPADLQSASCAVILRWGIAHWNAAKVPRTAQISGGARTLPL